jgi:proteic killer suppression protein
MIKSFADEATEIIWRGRSTPELPANIHSTALRKLRQLNAAVELNFLKIPPGNKLHPLGGDREGKHAIWVNTQYRLCFRWDGKDAHDVEITDYH